MEPMMPGQALCPLLRRMVLAEQAVRPGSAVLLTELMQFLKQNA